MKKKILILLTSLLVCSVFSQRNNEFKIGDTIYYNSYRSSYKKTDFFGVLKEIKQKSFLLDFYKIKKKSVIKTKTAYLKSLNDLNYHGEVIKYYDSGEISSKGYYNNGHQVGLWDFYLKNKMQNFSKFYKRIKKDLTKSKVIEAWDLKGNQTVKNGNGTLFLYHPDSTEIVEYGNLINGKKTGTWKKSNRDKLIFEEVYKEDKLIKGYSIDSKGKKYKYRKIIEKAKHRGGHKQIAKYISENFRLPKTYIKSNFKRKIYVLFSVNKEGKVINVRVSDSPHPDIYKEITRVLLQMKNWKPGKERGQLTTTNYVIPLIL